ncbi:MAG: L-threonylcarbamoyladenylate synthase [Cellulosilyticaceae bacterium]
MNTLIISDLTQLPKAAHLLQEGGLVATPTETVYGLAADAFNEDAVAQIFKAKGRPSDNPLIVHIASLEALDTLAQEIPAKAKTLMDAFWPGPLTLIFEATNKVPAVVRGGLSTVAVRFPSHPIMQSLITLAGVPVAAPSANLSGKPSPTNAQRVIDDLSGKVDAIIDGGDCAVGLESTVVDVTGPIPTILRPGGITHDMLTSVVGEVHVDPALLSRDESIKPKSPGMKYTHYSPNADVIIVKGSFESVIAEINDQVSRCKADHIKVGVLATEETKHLVNCEHILSVGTLSDLSTVATNLFEALRKFDDYGMDRVYSLAFPENGIGEAIMNRLEKSAGYNIIHKSS